MPGLTYTQYLTQVAQLAVTDATKDVNFLAIVPEMIDYAELRMQRDLDLMYSSQSLHGPSYILTAGNRNFSFAQNLGDGSSFVVSEQINVILPVGTDDPDVGDRMPLIPTTKEYLDAVYGSSSAPNRGLPRYFVPFNETYFFVGPVPDQNYNVELIGTLRAPPIGYLPPILSITSAGLVTFASDHNIGTGIYTIWLNNMQPVSWSGPFTGSRAGSTAFQISNGPGVAVTTIGASALGSAQSFISQYLPDLFIMASMIFISGYQRNFGRLSDDPQMAQSYEAQYQGLLKSAAAEEARKKFEAAAWSSQSPATVASPSRG